jgi:hypothetical protein
LPALISCKFGRAVLSRSWRQRSRSLPTRLANKPFGLNGSGISSASLEKSEGFGLRNMHTRASDADAVQRLQALEDFKFLRAPFDGVVINRSTDIGDLIVSGSGKNRTHLVELHVPNPSNELWPGAYTVVHFQLKSVGRSLMIPANTLGWKL